MTDYFPCLEARMPGGAFVHESWADSSEPRLIALLDSDWTAKTLCQQLASADTPESGRSWIITDSRGRQQIWNRKLIDAERERGA